MTEAYAMGEGVPELSREKELGTGQSFKSPSVELSAAAEVDR